jgi:CRP-like cAMP-binding protein
MHDSYTDHWLTQDLPPSAKSSLYKVGEVIAVDVDDILIEANRPNQSLFLLLEGAYKVYLPKETRRSNTYTLAHRGPGDLLGEYSFMDSFWPTATVQASTKGLVLRIGHEDFKNWLDSQGVPGTIVYRNILSYLVKRLRAQDEELECMMF